MRSVLRFALCAGTLGCAGDTGKPADTATDDAGTPTEDSATTCQDSGSAAEDAAAAALAVEADALAELPSGTCDLLIDPWVLDAPDDVTRIWAMVRTSPTMGGGSTTICACGSRTRAPTTTASTARGSATGRT